MQYGTKAQIASTVYRFLASIVVISYLLVVNNIHIFVIYIQHDTLGFWTQPTKQVRTPLLLLMHFVYIYTICAQ